MGMDLLTCPYCQRKFEPEDFALDDDIICNSCGTKIHLLPDGTCTYTLEEFQENDEQTAPVYGNDAPEIQEEEVAGISMPEAQTSEKGTPNALLDFSAEDIVQNMKNETCNMILGIITILWLIVFMILFLYNCIFASSIIKKEKKEKEVSYQQHTYRRYVKRLETFGGVPQKYAKNNKDNLPEQASLKEICNKYISEDYSANSINSCVTTGEYKVNFDLKKINGQNDDRMIFVSHPTHQVAFYMNGKIEKHTGKDKI